MSDRNLPAVLDAQPRAIRRQPISLDAIQRAQAEIDLRQLRRATAGPRHLSYAIIALFVGGLGGWAACAPLAGGAMASGVVAPEGSRKSVQHLEGGIVAELNVKDGDVVEAGQPLIVLASVQSRANFQLLHDRHMALQARLARLEAERANGPAIAFPAMLDASNPEVAKVMRSQEQILRARRERYETRQNILKRRIDQLEEQVGGYQAQVTSASQQIEFIRREIGAKDQLMRRGHLAQPEMLRLQRMEAEIVGRHGEYTSAVAKARQQIGETRLELLALDAERNDQTSAEMDKTRGELAEVTEQLKSSEDVLTRTVVRAPVAGHIVGMKYRSKGGVVQRGDTIMEIVPNQAKLMIEAQVSPLDIDTVHGGLPVLVNFPAFASRNAPRITGKLVSISADRLVENGSQRPYYLARVEIDRDELASQVPGVTLIPGMPADVLIVTKERTMLDYLTQPFRDALQRSFRQA